MSVRYINRRGEIVGPMAMMRYFYRLPKLWRILPLRVDSRLLHHELAYLGRTHGIVRQAVTDRSAVLWPKPSHIVMKRFILAARMAAIYLHRVPIRTGVCQHWGEYCRLPMISITFRAVDALDGVPVFPTYAWIETVTKGTTAECHIAPVVEIQRT